MVVGMRNLNFIPADAESIMQIQKSKGRHDDEIIWTLTIKEYSRLKMLIFFNLKIANLNEVDLAN